MEVDPTMMDLLTLAIGGLIAYVVKNLSDSMKELREHNRGIHEEVSEFKLHVSENYMKTSVMLDIRKEILDKLAHIESLLGQKQDKV